MRCEMCNRLGSTGDRGWLSILAQRGGEGTSVSFNYCPTCIDAVLEMTDDDLGRDDA